MDRKSFLKYAGLGSAGLVADSAVNPFNIFQESSQDQDPPNIIVIMSDDMGISDLGCYGSEILTPNLDGLAEGGAKFSQFYNAARCCPTRASLMTGLYPHQSGIGHMMKDRGAEGYRGDLNQHCLTIPEVLSEAGYSTYMSGKWHLTKHIGQWSGEEELTSKHNWPLQRGFDRFYGTIIGAGSYYNPISLVRDNTAIQPEVEDYYYTNAITDNVVKHINEHAQADEDKPFFSYAAYTAPHWPLHALEEDIKKYKGHYDRGWDQVRNRRMEKMQEIGLIDSRWSLSERDPKVPEWEKAENKEWEARRMAVYAAQIDRMDQGVGRIIKTLEQNDQLDNTLILFLCDNGGAAEVLTERWKHLHAFPDKTRKGKNVKVGNKPHIMPGPADTYQSYGVGWANASDTPFRLYKHYVHEGGIASPLIAHWPSKIKKQEQWKRGPSHLIDIMATCVDVADAEYPESYGGKRIHPMEGESLVPLFEGKQKENDRTLYWEHEGNSAIRDGKWKLVKRHKKQWELFNMEVDRTETEDLSERFPDKASRLKNRYDKWADRIGVLSWPVRGNN